MFNGGRTVHRTYGDGRWFSGEPAQLATELGGYIESAQVPGFHRGLIGGISPHAGYVYSGPVAGYTFRALRESALRFGAPDCLVIIGFSHSGGFPGIALMDGDAIATPLGETAMHCAAGKFLADAAPSARFEYAPHAGEHSAENQIPFAQVALPQTKLVVALMGDHSRKSIAELSDALAELSRQQSLAVVASTDLLHDPDYDKVTATDHSTLEMISGLDESGLSGAWSYEHQVCCGIAPVLTLLRFVKLRGVDSGTVLHYRNSGDECPESRGSWVVGYGAVVF